MELDQFKDINLVIDKANDIFIPRQFVSQGDYKGRSLTVQVTNNGSVGEVPGLTLNLNWHNEASGLTDLTAFTILDKTNSIFRIEYPENMMTPGKVYASIQIIQDGKVTNLKQFELIVQELAGQPVGIVEKAEFSALVAVLADSNKFRTDIDSVINGLNSKFDTNQAESYLKSITAVPETFANLAAIQAKYPNGTNGIMVAADNGHKYIWANNTWTDAGAYQAVALPENDRQTLDNAIAGIAIANPTSTPYDDLNTLPINRVVTYSVDITSFKHAPQNLAPNTGATVVTYSFSSNNNSGAIQTLVTSAGQQAWRVCWGYPASWRAWQTQTVSVEQVFFGATCNAPYNDLNTVPVNSRIVYSDGINHLANIPSELANNDRSGMQVITEGFIGNKPGSLQTIYLSTGETYQRMVWVSDGQWQKWHLASAGDFYLGGRMVSDHTGAPYDDLNTFPMNQTVVIAETPSTISAFKHLPPISSSVQGLTIISHSWSDSSIGGIQIAIDTDNIMHHRIAWGSDNNWGDWRSEKPEQTYFYPTLSLFEKVGVIGDSYASGELAFDGHYIDHYEISWLQILARKDGFTGTNFSKGGISTRTWLTDQKCMPVMQSSDAQDLYILALGINDEALGISYIGSEADIDNGADTFYGNYGKIIKAIKIKAPQAKIVIATIANSNDIGTKFNEAITTIANHFTIPVIVQLDDPLFNSHFYNDNMIGGHPTGPVYASMAEAFERLIGHSMIDHLDYYNTFKKDA